MRRGSRSLAVVAVALGAIACASPAFPCSRILWNDNGRSVLVGRNMDWKEDLQSNLWVLPRGMARDGLAPTNPLKWTSRYGSLVVTAYDALTCDGLNEKGLAVHMLYLSQTKCGPRDESRPGLAISLWAQYYLDQFATVAEAVKAMEADPFQLLMVVEPTSGAAGTIHLALDDSSGDSAVLECLDGKVRIHHDRKYTVMTNEPAFDKQLANLEQYRGFGGDRPLPGSTEPADRFVRGAYYVRHLPEPKSDREAVAALLSVMRNVSAPFGVADPERPNVATTIWRTVTDLTHGVLYYDGTSSAQIFRVDARKLDYREGAPVKKLQVVGNYDLMGDATGAFRDAAPIRFLGPE